MKINTKTYTEVLLKEKLTLQTCSFSKQNITEFCNCLSKENWTNDKSKILSKFIIYLTSSQHYKLSNQEKCKLADPLN